MQTMPTLTAVLVDDEQSCTDNLSLKLQAYCPQVGVVAVCNDPQEAVEQIRLLKPDLVFLDIQMPGMNGIDLLGHFPEAPFMVIFTTAFQEYAIQAIRLKALDYLLKPVKQEDLERAVQEAVTRKEGSASNPAQFKEHEVSALRHLIAEYSDSPKTIWLKGEKGFLNMYYLKDIGWFKANGDYAAMQWFDGQKLQKPFIDEGIGSLEEKLSGLGFFRAHHSSLVNRRHIIGYKKNEGVVRMKDGAEVEVSRRRKEAFEKWAGFSD